MRTAWRGGLFLVAIAAGGCESPQMRDQIAHQALAIDGLERSLGEVRRQREAREMVEQRLTQLASTQAEQSVALAQLKTDLAACSATLSGHQGTADQAANELNILTRRIEIIEAAQDDIVGGLQSLARNRQDLLRLDQRLTHVEQQLEALQADLRQLKVKGD